MYVICYGDSNTYGFDPRSFFGERYAPEHRWPDILEKETGWMVDNEGMNGREVPCHRVKFPKDADLILVMLGTNDLLQGCLPEKVAAKMEYFLDGLESDKVLLIAPPALAFGEWIGDQKLVDASRALAGNYKELAARRRILFADASEWNIPLCFDGVHFTEAGHEIFAKQLLREIRLVRIFPVSN